jgi:hypothetical protein
MTARGGLGKAFAAAVGEWAAASERVVRPAKTAAAEPAGLTGLPVGEWAAVSERVVRPARAAAEPVPLAAVTDLSVGEPGDRISGVLDGVGDSAPEQPAVRP